MESYSIQRKQKRPLEQVRKRSKRHQNHLQEVSLDGIDLECYECHRLVKVTTTIVCPQCDCRILQSVSDNPRTLDAL